MAISIQQKKLIRILSLDGGGIKGIITGKVLEGLETELNEVYENRNGKKPDRPLRLAQCFDFIAGTSTGGILTSLILCPESKDSKYPKYSATEAVALYIEHGREIFKPSYSGLLPGLFNGIFGAKYGNKNIEMLLKQYLGDFRLKDMILPCLIASYDIERRCAVFFTSADAVVDPASDFPMWQVARSTSAAPTYFPPAMAESGAQPTPPVNTDNLYHNIDGGLFANNPTMCALVEAVKLFQTTDADGSKHLRFLDDFFVLSIGTGTVEKPYPFDKAVNWGVLKWLKPIISIMMSAVSETVDYQLNKLYKMMRTEGQYFRIKPGLGNADSEMDNVSPENLKALLDAGAQSAYENQIVLTSIANILLDNN